MSKSYRRRGEANISSFSDEYSANATREEAKIEIPEIVEPKKDLVKVTIENLNIRKGPGKEFDRTGKFTGAGTFELVERKNGYGKLKSGEGWIMLDFCEEI